MGEKQTHILIVGLGASGRATALYCLDRAAEYAQITLVDGNDSEELRQFVSSLTSLDICIEAHLGAQQVPELSYDLAVLSPGIAPNTMLHKSAISCASEVVSEIEFAYRASGHRWVAITGSNGKTTTTALTTHLLQSGGLPAVAVGNIGQPAIEAVACHSTDTIMVAEVSSFQLYSASTFAPDVSAILNVTPDHLDWHGTMDDYVAAKFKVFARQTTGSRVLLYAQDEYYQLAKQEASQTGAEVVTVGLDSRSDLPVLTLDEDALAYCASDKGCERYCAVEELRIKGAHNVVNALFAIGIAQYFGLDPQAIKRGLSSFAPVAHRLQYVTTIQGVDWYNDSKATNPDAVFKAVDALCNQPITLLVGGRNKGNDFTELLSFVRTRVCNVICFGEAGPDIYHAANAVYDEGAISGGPNPSVYMSNTMLGALEIAAQVALTGGVILLSPACASFDEFAGYHQRGEVFAEYANNLAGLENNG